MTVHSDEGIGGTNTKKRDGFHQIITDALAGKMDLIAAESVSRSARNTVDSLATVREPKEHGFEIFFVKEGVWARDFKGELLMPVMRSSAPEESRSISENVPWASGND